MNNLSSFSFTAKWPLASFSWLRPQKTFQFLSYKSRKVAIINNVLLIHWHCDRMHCDCVLKIAIKSNRNDSLEMRVWVIKSLLRKEKCEKFLEDFFSHVADFAWMSAITIVRIWIIYWSDVIYEAKAAQKQTLIIIIRIVLTRVKCV